MRATLLTVHGEPAPQGSKRHVGHGRLIEQSTKVKPWRAAIVAACLARRVQPLEGPLGCEIVFTLRKPLSAPKRTIAFPAKRPDLDKLYRSTLDGLVDGSALVDDSQIVHLAGWKVYVDSGHPWALAQTGALILMVELAGMPPGMPASWLSGLAADSHLTPPPPL